MACALGDPDSGTRRTLANLSTSICRAWVPVEPYTCTREVRSSKFELSEAIGIALGWTQLAFFAIVALIKGSGFFAQPAEPAGSSAKNGEPHSEVPVPSTMVIETTASRSGSSARTSPQTRRRNQESGSRARVSPQTRRRNQQSVPAPVAVVPLTLRVNPKPEGRKASIMAFAEANTMESVQNELCGSLPIYEKGATDGQRTRRASKGTAA